MKKNEFLSELRRKLKILKQEEIDDIIKEYENTINEKIKNGSTEEDAIKDFGNIDELVKEILDAYKISTNNNTFEDKLSDFISKATNWFQEFFTNLSNGSAEEILTFIIKIFVVLLIIGILRFPFYLIKGLGSGLLEIFPYPIETILIFIFKLIIELTYIIVSILIVYSAFKNKVKFKKETPKKEKKELNKNSETKEKTINETKHEPIKKVQKQENNNDLGKTIESIFLGILKVFGVIFLIPFYCLVIGLFIALGLIIGLMVKGLFIIGPTIILIGIIIAVICFISIINKILFGKEVK